MNLMTDGLTEWVNKQKWGWKVDSNIFQELQWNYNQNRLAFHFPLITDSDETIYTQVEKILSHPI